MVPTNVGGGGRGKQQQQQVEQQPPPELDRIDAFFEKQIVVPGLYSNQRECLKSLRNIVQHAPEKLFVLQKSFLSIFRYEDVLFSIHPHMAAHRRRGVNSKEVFLTVDPQAKRDSNREKIGHSSTSPVGFHQDFNMSGFNDKKGSELSGAALGKQSLGDMRASEKSYGIPTLKMLNPELYKEMEK